MSDGIRLSELVWPITVTYFVRGPWGDTAQELTFEAPELYNDVAASRRLCWVVWAASLASASTASMIMDVMFVRCWKVEDTPFPAVLPPITGARGGSTAPRSRSGCIVMLPAGRTGHGSRRLYLPGIPLSWTTPDLLTKTGAEEMQTLARGLFLGMADGLSAPPLRWLLAYPRMFEGTLPGTYAPGFRLVDHLRVCQYVERAPEPQGYPGVS